MTSSNKPEQAAPHQTNSSAAETTHWAEALSQELLATGHEVRFMMRGYSMWPFMRPGKHAIIAHYPFEQLNRGDVVVFRLHGQVVAHRVHRKMPGTPLRYQVKGDSNATNDPLLVRENYLGRVKAIAHNNRQVHLLTRRWRLYTLAVLVCSSPRFPVIYLAKRVRFLLARLVKKVG